MAGKTTTAPATDPADDLLSEADGLFDGAAVDNIGDSEFGDADDLLNEVKEDDAEGWNPTEVGEGIAGVIVGIGQTRSDFAAPGTDPMVPTVTVQTRDGKWRVIGFASVLRRELEAGLDNGTIKVGNLFAVKYFGEKVIKKGQFAGKNYRHYTVLAKAPKKA